MKVERERKKDGHKDREKRVGEVGERERERDIGLHALLAFAEVSSNKGLMLKNAFKCLEWFDVILSST